MPTYEYLCQTCSHRFEVWQKMSDEPLQICPECGNHIRRVLYPAGIVFKGSGFYKTDHRNGSSAVMSDESKKAEPAEAGSSSETPAPKSGEKSGESKPAASNAGNSSTTSGSGSSSGESKVAAGTKS
jgi:putative FmdB family regulatory protein